MVAYGEVEILNKIGDLLTITHETWELSWDPDCEGNVKDLVTFGRNRRTGYSGLIRVRTIAELEAEDVERWRKSNLFPPDPDYSQYHAWFSALSSPQCAHSETCYCRENIDPVAEFKHNRRYKPTL